MPSYYLLTSLSNKLAVLGPERLAAEAPRSLPVVSALLEAVGYRRERTYTDYLRPRSPVEPVPQELVMPITVAELDEYGQLEIPGHVAWQRQRQTLLNSKEELEGLAIAAPERDAGLSSCGWCRLELRESGGTGFWRPPCAES